MFNRWFFASVLFLVAFTLSSIAVFAQVTTINGKVMLRGDSGATTPVAGASVMCYNVTNFTQLTKLKCGSTKTDEAGKYVLSGLSETGRYIIAVSRDGIGPRITLPVKPGEKEEIILVIKGDGKVLSIFEVWGGFAFSKSGTSFTAEQKLAQTQYDKRIAEIKAAEAKSKENTAKLNGILKQGDDAYESSNFDLAIEKYDEGFNAAPEFIRSAPIFLARKARTLRQKSVQNIVAAQNAKDSAMISKARAQAEKELPLALDAVIKSYTLLTKDTPSDADDKAENARNMFATLYHASKIAGNMANLGIADADNKEIVKTMVGLYLKREKDKGEKRKAQKALADYLMGVYDYSAAAAEYKKALGYAKKDMDVLVLVGLALYSTGDTANNQEALNYLDYFLKNAPKDHKMRDGLPEIFKILTVEQKLKPQKIN